MESTVTANVAHSDLQAAVEAAGLGVDASELHGLLVGYLCGGARMPKGKALTCLALEAEAENERLAGLLDTLASQCRQQLDALEAGLQPLLPEDAQPLSERVDTLLEWTRGFLGGFGLAGVDAALLTSDGKEVLRDLATIAGTDPALEDASTGAGEEDESAWMELVEFVRVGGMLLHAELAAARKDHG